MNVSCPMVEGKTLKSWAGDPTRTMNEDQLLHCQPRIRYGCNFERYLPSLPSQYCEGAKEKGLGTEVADETDEEVMAKTRRAAGRVDSAVSYRDSQYQIEVVKRI